MVIYELEIVDYVICKIVICDGEIIVDIIDSIRID